ncbi:hypothetical protein BgiMline_017625 [Biomphalaria glabrata]
MQRQSLIMLIGYVVDVRERFRTLLEVDLRKPRDDDPTTAPLRSSDGSTILTRKADMLNRWTEHYSLLFGDKTYVSEESLANIPQNIMREELDDSPTFEEIETAIHKK